MGTKFMPLADCTAFGWCYGRLAALAPDLATPGRYSNAMNLPLIGWGALHNQMMAEGRVSAELQSEMSQALVGVGADNLQTNAYGQTAFAMGYYRGNAGLPFVRSFDIATARKEKGMTQQALADALGVAQARIVEWEKGKVTPRPETLERIKELLS